VTAYGEIRYNLSDMFQVYGGAQGWSVKLPTTPTMELDLYAGLRTTVGAFGLDLGVMRYVYPGEVQLLAPVSPAGTDFTEVYGKATYTINEMFTVGANVFYAPNWLGTGASGTYVSGTAKVTLPMDFAVSGELGRYYLGTTDPVWGAQVVGATNLPDYTYWNAGLSYTYKFATLDLRYHDTTLSKNQCGGLTGDPRGAITGRSNWCGQAFIATLSFDLTSKDLK
jgi:uncharacterized protein (TIGR02001 family)